MGSDLPLSIIGAGGHAKVVVDAYQQHATHGTLQVFDQNVTQSHLLGITIHPYQISDIAKGHVHVAIGNNETRHKLCLELLDKDIPLCTVIHPTATVSPHASIGPGCFIAAGAIIGPEAKIGTGVIVNHHAVVDHECQIGDFTHLAPHSTLGGNVTVGALTLVGSAATILPNLNIGEKAILGGGAVVTQNIDAALTVVGVPAQSI